MIRNVIVFGATGKTGIQICRELEIEKLTYAVFVRENSFNKLVNSSVLIKQGDVLNAHDVESAFNDEDFTDVIIALGSKDLKNTKIRSIGTKNIVDAMTKTESKANIHVLSALGIGESWSQLKWPAKLISNVLIKSTMNDHSKQEDAVRASSLPHHIIRPVALKDGESDGEAHVQNVGFLPSNSIQRVDVARFIVKNLLDNKQGRSGICENSI